MIESPEQFSSLDQAGAYVLDVARQMPDFQTACQLLQVNHHYFRDAVLFGGMVARILRGGDAIKGGDVDIAVPRVHSGWELPPGFELSHNVYGSIKILGPRGFELDLPTVNNLTRSDQGHSPGLRPTFTAVTRNFLEGAPLQHQGLGVRISDGTVVGLRDERIIADIKDGRARLNNWSEAERYCARKPNLTPEQYLRKKTQRMGLILD